MRKLVGFGVIAGLGAAAVVGAADFGRIQLTPASVDTEALVARGYANPLIAQCFEQGTSPEVMANVGVQLHGLGQRFFTGARWPGSQGTPVSLTYSFPPDGLNIPSGVGEAAAPNELNARLNAQFGGNTAQWKSLFQQAFDRWGQLTGNVYTEVADDGAAWGSSGSPGLRGDVRISMKPVDGASNTLAYNSFPSGGGDMVMDRAENWASAGGNFRFLRNVVMHEHGHGLGMFHSCPQNASKIMEPGLNTNIDGPQQDDIRAGHFLYGDPLEPNNATVNATDLDALGITVNVPLNINNTLSLHGVTDQDHFVLTAPASAAINVTVTATGTTYANGPQNGDGSCSAGVALNARAQQDLVIDILNSGGGVLGTINNTTVGNNEAVVGFNLGSAGTYFVRVRSNFSQGNVQAYNLAVTLTNQGIQGDLNGDGCVNATDLAVMLGVWGPTQTNADLNGDLEVNAADLALLLGAWGQGC